jgi:hypothetical protein
LQFLNRIFPQIQIRLHSKDINYFTIPETLDELVEGE